MREIQCDVVTVSPELDGTKYRRTFSSPPQAKRIRRCRLLLRVIRFRIDKAVRSVCWEGYERDGGGYQRMFSPIISDVVGNHRLSGGHDRVTVFGGRVLGCVCPSANRVSSNNTFGFALFALRRRHRNGARNFDRYPCAVVFVRYARVMSTILRLRAQQTANSSHA